jgi:RNA polymerase sigma-70 factor (ECF subfamily)
VFVFRRFLEAEALTTCNVSRPDGLVQTNAFEIKDGVITAISVMRNPDKLKHLASP